MYVIQENIENIKGQDVLNLNINAVEAIVEAIQTTFGPFGLNKMIVDTLGDVMITNDGAKVLEEMSIENPSAKMIVDLSKSIQKKVGDGSISVVLFIGALMEKVQELTSMGLDPAHINNGFSLALKKSIKILEAVSRKLDLQDRKTISNIIRTALESKNLSNAKDLFIDFILKVVDYIRENDQVDLDNLQIIKKEGKSLLESQFVKGLIIDKEVLNPNLPKNIKNAKIALIDAALEIVKTDYSSEIEITDPSKIQDFLNHEDSIINKLVVKLKENNVNVVFCQKGIDESAQHYLGKNGIMSIRRVKHSDMKKLSRATGANIVTNIRTLSQNDIGGAGSVSEKKIGKYGMIFVEDCKDPKAVTVLIRGTGEQTIDDAQRTLTNGIKLLKSLYKNPYIVGGGGSIEMEIRNRLLDYAKEHGGKEQIVIEHFAEALLSIPILLIENSGNDPLEIVTELKSKNDYSKDKITAYDTLTRTYVDCMQAGLIDPMEVKKQIITMAAEIAIVFIRIDDYFKISK